MIKWTGFLIAVFCLGIAISYGYHFVTQSSQKPISTVADTQQPTVPAAKKMSHSIFVPYWDIEKKGEPYSRYFYFGVAPSLSGINELDQGFIKLKEFVDTYDTSASYLTLRMTDSDLNSSILDNKKAQQTIVNDVTRLAADNGFAGVALDLEYSGLFDGSIPGKISGFSHLLSDTVKGAKLKYTFIVYGDVVYRHRPYDIKELSKYADEVIVMAYDFHKSRGEPGPNFPLFGKEQYGYDFTQMVEDVSQSVSVDKITIAYGMFGYEWIVDDQKRPIKPATALSLNEIAQQYDQECVVLNCVKERESISGETEIEYVAKNGDYHIIWHEDNTSVKQKQVYAMSRGISSFSYWANGYFGNL